MLHGSLLIINWDLVQLLGIAFCPTSPKSKKYYMIHKNIDPIS